MQFEKEKIYAKAAEEISAVNAKPVLIVCDRGMLDNKACVTDEGFTDLLNEMHLAEEECLSWYDAAFHNDAAGY